MPSIDWSQIVTIAMSAAVLVWRLGVIAGRIHTKLDLLVSTTQRQEERLNSLQRGMHTLWRSVRTLRGRVTAIELATRTPPGEPHSGGSRPSGGDRACRPPGASGSC